MNCPLSNCTEPGARPELTLSLRALHIIDTINKTAGAEIAAKELRPSTIKQALLVRSSFHKERGIIDSHESCTDKTYHTTTTDKRPSWYQHALFDVMHKLSTYQARRGGGFHHSCCALRNRRRRSSGFREGLVETPMPDPVCFSLSWLLSPAHVHIASIVH
jgi:hypothetical protein